MNDINLRTKFCNDPNLSKHGQHLKQESQQELYEGSHGKHQEKKYEQSSTNRTGRKFDKSYPYVDKRILASNDSQRPSLDSRYTNQGRPNAYVSTGNNADNHNNHGDLNVRRQPLNDNITYIPCDRFTGQSVEVILSIQHVTSPRFYLSCFIVGKHGILCFCFHHNHFLFCFITIYHLPWFIGKLAFHKIYLFHHYNYQYP